ncbi:MAG: formate dehydrogenase subunit gamma [Xanthobacteraceae bacterium]|jgi:formate dehydrogenase subunit gamma
MRIQFSRIRIFAGVLLLLLVAALAFPAAAQQAQRNPDGSVNPTASAVNEQKLLQTLGQIDGRVSIPAQRAGVLIQPAGREWRDFHEVTLRIIGAVAIIGMLALLVIFYLWRGMVRLEAGRSGRTLVRFNAFERGVHWMTATCFVILAISGLNITFGRPLLLPLLGPETFTAWSQWAKYAHNFLSFPFTLGVVLIFLMWIAGNIPNRVDFQWLKAGGGIVGQEHPPAQRFNAGQKLIYWIVVLGGGAAAATGYLLLFPFYVTDIAGMQIAQVIHSVVAMLFIAAMLGHIYIGTIGMEGAFEAMGTGEVDVNWAKQHHSLWLDEEQARARETQARPAATPAE